MLRTNENDQGININETLFLLSQLYTIILDLTEQSLQELNCVRSLLCYLWFENYYRKDKGDFDKIFKKTV